MKTTTLLKTLTLAAACLLPLTTLDAQSARFEPGSAFVVAVIDQHDVPLGIAYIGQVPLSGDQLQLRLPGVARYGLKYAVAVKTVPILPNEAGRTPSALGQPQHDVGRLRVTIIESPVAPALGGATPTLKDGDQGLEAKTSGGPSTLSGSGTIEAESKDKISCPWSGYHPTLSPALGAVVDTVLTPSDTLTRRSARAQTAHGESLISKGREPAPPLPRLVRRLDAGDATTASSSGAVAGSGALTLVVSDQGLDVTSG